jgi:hypothetical protein
MKAVGEPQAGWEVLTVELDWCSWSGTREEMEVVMEPD